MNISDIRTRVDALNDRSCLVARRAEPEETPILTLVESADVDTAEAEPEETPILTLVESADVDTADQSDTGELPDPLIQALVDKLPKPNSIWSIDDRAKWLKATAMAFNLVYRYESSSQQKPEETSSVLKSVG